MKKEDKTLMIDKIKETLDKYSVVYLANTTSLNAEKTVDLRRAAFMDACDIDYSGLYDSLAGPTTLLLSDTGNAPAKLIKEFRGKKETIPAFKAAYVEETVYVGEQNLDTLVAIKSKNELIADVVALLQSPAKNVISALQSGGNKLHGVLETLSKKEN